MNKRQSNKMNMYKAVSTFLQKNQAEYSSIPVLQNQLGELETLIQKIVDTDAERESIKAGKTADKLQEEKELLEDLSKAISAMNVFAQISGNNELLEETSYSEYDLKKMRDNDFLEKAYAVYNKASGLKTELADYGLTEADIESIKTNADEFAQALGVTGAANAESKEYTANLQSIFDDVDGLLNEKIDRLMQLFKIKNKTLYEGYNNARQIIDR